MAKQALIIDGNAIAARIRADARERLERLAARGERVRVAVVLAPDSPVACLYVARQRERFTDAGIECVPTEILGTASEAEFIGRIRRLNEDPATTGIVLALPLPAGVNVRAVQQSIAPSKDIEGVHPHNLGMIAAGRQGAGPSTGQAVLEVIDATGTDVRGTEAVVVGHSEIVGKPVALGLLERLATVTVCHVATRDLAFHTRRADVLVVAVGKPGLIAGDMVKEGAVVVDVGINRIPGPDGKPRTVGDVDFETVRARAGWITPVPGGVGPVTVAVLLRNAIRAAGG